MNYKRSLKILLILLFISFLPFSSVLAKRITIARFDVVPYQIVDSLFEVGVIAFHMDGVKEVVFIVSDGTTEKSFSVTTPSLNPRTNVKEFWFLLDPALFNDGPLVITALAIPDISSPTAETRALSLELYNNANGTHDVGKILYVSPNGIDTNPGTKDKPVASLLKALYSLKGSRGGGTIILLEEGRYHLGKANKNLAPLDINNWITITAADGLNRDNVILYNKTNDLVRLYTQMIHWKNVSFEFDNIVQIYNASYDWFENCRWYTIRGREKKNKPSLQNVRNYYYVTDSLVHDMVYGFHFCKLLRNSKLERISGDAIQMNQLTVNVTLDDLNGGMLTHHSDVYQMWDEMDNTIVYNLQAINLINTQSIFLQPVNNIPKDEPVVAMSNSAFVNCLFENDVTVGPGKNNGGPPFSQMQAKFEHILFKKISLPWQQMIFRTDMSGNRTWNATDVIFEDSVLHYLTYKKFVNPNSSRYIGPPSGVSFKNCRSGPIFKKK